MSLRVRGAAVSITLLCAALTGCASAPKPSAYERAIALYREGRSSPDAGSPRGAGPAQRARGIPRGAPLVLTVDDAVAWAREHSAELAAENARAEAAAAQVEAEDRFENPELRLSNLDVQRMVDREPRATASIRFPLTRPGEVGADVAAARADEAKARSDARALEIEMEADIRARFDEVRILDAEIAAADAVAAARRSHAAWMKEQLAAARTTALDEVMTELTAVDAEQAAMDLRAQRSTALGALLARMGLPPETPVQLVGEPMTAWPLPELPTEQEAVELALRRRPEIELAAAQIDAADAALRAGRGERWPWLSFFEVGYDFEPDTRPGLGWTFELAIELPIFNTRSATVAAASAARRAEQRALAAAVELVTREVRTTLSEARAAREAAIELRRRMLPVAERADAEAKRAREGRDIEMSRALEADERRWRLEQRLLRFARRYWTAVGELRRALGGRLPAEEKRAPRRGAVEREGSR